jgi:hypothetical protein
MIPYLVIILVSYVMCILYVKWKMKRDSEKILQDLKDEIDKRNLENLVKLSEKKQNPGSYNDNIIKYEEEVAIYAGLRALKSPIETCTDFFETLGSY